MHLRSSSGAVCNRNICNPYIRMLYGPKSLLIKAMTICVNTAHYDASTQANTASQLNTRYPTAHTTPGHGSQNTAHQPHAQRFLCREHLTRSYMPRHSVPLPIQSLVGRITPAQTCKQPLVPGAFPSPPTPSSVEQRSSALIPETQKHTHKPRCLQQVPNAQS